MNIDQIFTKAAKIEAKSLKKHFKKDKWGLDYRIVLEQLFYTAVGKHLESFLFKELSNTSLKLTCNDNFQLFIEDKVKKGSRVLINFKGKKDGKGRSKRSKKSHKLARSK